MFETFNAFWLLTLFGILSGVLSTFAYLPYIIDTARGDTKPQRASWLIWSVLGSIAFFSQVFEGATDSLWFAGVQVSGTIVVCLLSIRFGVGGFMNRRDAVIMAIAAAALLIWYLTETPAYALAITITISLLGGSVTVLKAFQAPESETISTWAISAVASACAVLAVGRFDPILLAYPVYLLTLNSAIVLAVLSGRASRAIPLRVHR